MRLAMAGAQDDRPEPSSTAGWSNARGRRVGASRGGGQHLGMAEGKAAEELVVTGDAWPDRARM